ncbi:uncharacterized protein LOC125221355 [Salvia hispanica]|uniref:uncharacterized protein LOC125221355 n=1 Tax=Salvia hispanica TaxID=49212 RepID=UPI002009204B|nr:uncharacterized protein LOC125221355 [Salvia hispanica]
MEMDGSTLVKVVLFILVQGLVYLILSQSSNVFSKLPRSHSFKTARTLSIRRWAAALADIPAASGEASPQPRDFSAPSAGRINLSYFLVYSFLLFRCMYIFILVLISIICYFHFPVIPFQYTTVYGVVYLINYFFESGHLLLHGVFSLEIAPAMASKL